MAQVGDTITYTFSDGSSVAEDVSNVGEAEILYCEAGGDGKGNNAGGRAENVIVDVSNESTLYIWVGEQGGSGDLTRRGRYFGADAVASIGGGGSSEVSLLNTDSSDSATEPFIVAAGGGAGGQYFDFKGDGARGGTAEGQAPPKGGRVSGDKSGEAAVAGHGTTATIKESGTTITGGGVTNGDGEIKISYKSGLEPPDPPSNLTAEV